MAPLSVSSTMASLRIPVEEPEVVVSPKAAVYEEMVEEIIEASDNYEVEDVDKFVEIHEIPDSNSKSELPIILGEFHHANNISFTMPIIIISVKRPRLFVGPSGKKIKNNSHTCK